MKDTHPLDVYHLPSSSLDSKHPVWWGNTLLICVESTIFALLVVLHFYVRKNFEPWPPPLTVPRPDPSPLPGLGFATANILLQVLSCLPMLWIDRGARARIHEEIASEARTAAEIPQDAGYPRHTFSWPVRMFVALTVLGLGMVWLRFGEFHQLRFSWHDNAYASVIWAILVAHLTYLLMSVFEVALLAIWVWRDGWTQKFALDTTLAAGSWYWTVAIGLVLYVVVFWTPRWLPT